jgi:hypothetical protein
MDKELPIQITVPKSEYIPYCDDLVRIVTIQFVIQFMMMLRGASSFDTDFLELVLYILAGVSMYWLILKGVYILCCDQTYLSFYVDRVTLYDWKTGILDHGDHRYQSCRTHWNVHSVSGHEEKLEVSIEKLQTRSACAKVLATPPVSVIEEDDDDEERKKGEEEDDDEEEVITSGSW